MAEEFGAAVRTLRNQAGLTQEELAHAAGVADRTVRRLEAGESPDTRVATLRLIANALADALGRDRKELLHELTALRSGDTVSAILVSEESGTAPGFISEAAGTDGLTGPVILQQGPIRPEADLAGFRVAADNLAHTVRDRWIREEENRRIHDPKPLPVRWHAAREGLVDDGLPDGAWLPASGTLADIAQTYRSVAGGRLVVLGRAGSGKTVLALRFVVDYLDSRRPGEAVPVIFSLGSWNPTAVSLRDWLAHRLLRDHPELGTPAPGSSTLAAALLAAGWILPVLDGFDEMAEGLQGVALNEFNATTLPFVLTSRIEQFQQAVGATRVLNRAAGIELGDLTVADLADYLPGTALTGKTRAETAAETGAETETEQDAASNVWQPVLAAIGEHPEEKNERLPLAEVLRTPLMVLLARTMYSDARDRDPAELLEDESLQSVDGLERHLLAGFVPALYQDSRKPMAVNGQTAAPRRESRSWSAADASRYAGYIAAHLRRSQDQAGQDLAWWRLGDSVRPVWRVVAVTLAGVVVTFIAHLLVVLPYDVLSPIPYSVEPDATFVDTFLVGPAVGLSFGLIYALLVLSGRFTIRPSRLQVRLFRRRHRAVGQAGPTDRSMRARFTTWSAFGFLGGTALGCGYGVAQTAGILLLGYAKHATLGDVISVTLTDMAVFTLVFGLAAGVAFGLMTTLTVPDDVSAAPTPLSLLAANRTAVLRQFLVLVPLLSLAIGLGGAGVVFALQGPLGPLTWPFQAGLAIGVTGGVVGVSMYVLTFTSWGQWLLLVRIWLPLTGRLPWATAAFLEDAYRRGLLRRSGAVYQFRHARLLAQLGAAAEVEAPTR